MLNHLLPFLVICTLSLPTFSMEQPCFDETDYFSAADLFREGLEWLNLEDQKPVYELQTKPMSTPALNKELSDESIHEDPAPYPQSPLPYFNFFGPTSIFNPLPMNFVHYGPNSSYKDNANKASSYELKMNNKKRKRDSNDYYAREQRAKRRTPEQHPVQTALLQCVDIERGASFVDRNLVKIEVTDLVALFTCISYNYDRLNSTDNFNNRLKSIRQFFKGFPKFAMTAKKPYTIQPKNLEKYQSIYDSVFQSEESTICEDF